MLHFPTWKIILVLGVIASGVLFAAPNLLSSQMRVALAGFAPTDRVNLGLDLRGGSHLLLEVDVKAAVSERLETLRDEIRTVLRKERIGYRGLRVEAGEVRLTLREGSDAPRARELIEEIDAPFGGSVFRITLQKDISVEIDDAGQVRIAPSDDAVREQTRSVLVQSIEIVRRRIDELGTTEPVVQRQGNDRILVQAPGYDKPERLKALLGQTAKLNFQLVNTTADAYTAVDKGVPPGSELLYTQDTPRQPIVLYRRVMISGENLVDAQPAFDQFTNQPVVTFRLDAQGGRRFGEITTQNVNKPFAIVLDGKVISAPVIEEPILGGRAQIQGRFTIEEANDLAILLRAGALPAPLHILEERTVGPGLGADSIRAGVIASIIGLVAVVAFIIIVYGMFGLYANLALLANLTLLIGALSLLQATLTLPGIAGIVLTIGMAVDANVLIFERIREEAGTGKPPISAIDAGYRRALGTILDANITTFIAAAILFLVGSGPVRGFAVTLGIGITTSVFTAFTFTRLLAAVWVRRQRPKTLPLSSIAPLTPSVQAAPAAPVAPAAQGASDA